MRIILFTYTSKMTAIECIQIVVGYLDIFVFEERYLRSDCNFPLL